MQRTWHRNRTENKPARRSILRHGRLLALTALASLDTRSRQLGHPRRALNVSDRDETVHTATCPQVVGRVRRLETYRQRICVLDRPQTLLLISPDRSCEPGHAFSPTWSSTLRHVLVPGSHGPRLKPPAEQVIIGVEK